MPKSVIKLLIFDVAALEQDIFAEHSEESAANKMKIK